MELNDKPLTTLHPFLKVLYDDLLNRLTIAQNNFNTVNSNLTAATSNIIKVADDVVKTKTDVSSASSDLNKIKSDILNNTTAITQHAVDINNRLRKDAADSTPFTLSVGAPVAMSNAVTKNDLVGGVLRPYRVFRNVSASDKGATVRAGQNAQIVDSLNLGMVYSITSIRIKTITSPSLTTTITIKNGSTVIFTKTILVANISAVGALTDLLGIGTVMPADLTLPATLTCSATSGTYDIIVDGLLN